ncbi:hypothetical protein FRC02_007507 [Tulasnella sp. 418]|nr:hypothetical protein FRC02_007507 [Tulasnella sp. 418]
MLSNGWLSTSPVSIYVQRCCEPSLSEPNYALNLELAEYIVQKKANTARDAAMAVVQYINHRNPHVAILAISLLQTLVQHVGYPMHLQVSTKEFLNELVRRFPERPPPFPGPVMSRILETIHLWRETICKDSRWKEDLGNIRDMHRLLSFKGYRFKDLNKNVLQNVASSANANLKSPEELENEDREAQQAKLQELIRRGTPRDLAAAQELMKTLSGANPDAKPDYKAQTLHELEKLQSKVILLNDLLDNVDKEKGERFVKGDAYDQVATICAQARPKIQKWISDAEGDPDDSDALDTFLNINDLINNVLDRYERYKKGDYSEPVQPEASSSSSKNDLIDLDLFDGSSSNNNAPGQSASTPGNVTDDLAELFGPPTTSNAPAPSTFNFLASTQGAAKSSTPTPTFSFGQHPTSMNSSFGLTSANTHPGTSNSPAPNHLLGGIALPITPNHPRSMTPQSGSGFTPVSQPNFGAPQSTSMANPITPSTQPPAQQNQSQSASKGKDPFADLVGLF